MSSFFWNPPNIKHQLWLEISCFDSPKCFWEHPLYWRSRDLKLAERLLSFHGMWLLSRTSDGIFAYFDWQRTCLWTFWYINMMYLLNIYRFMRPYSPNRIFPRTFSGVNVKVTSIISNKTKSLSVNKKPTVLSRKDHTFKIKQPFQEIFTTGFTFFLSLLTVVQN